MNMKHNNAGVNWELVRLLSRMKKQTKDQSEKQEGTGEGNSAHGQ